VAGFELGWTTSVASTHNSSLAEAFEHQNSIWVNLLDATKFWNDSLSTTVDATRFDAIKNVTEEDGRFWFVGARATYALNDRVSIETGYEKTLGLMEFREDRVTLSLVYGF
jgi:glycosidase